LVYCSVSVACSLVSLSLFPPTSPPYIYTLSLHDALPIFRLRCGSRLVSTSSPELSSRRRSGSHRSGFSCRIAIAERRSDEFVHHRPVVLIPVEWLSLYLSVGESLQTRRQGHFISFDDETAAVFHSALN